MNFKKISRIVAICLSSSLLSTVFVVPAVAVDSSGSESAVSVIYRDELGDMQIETEVVPARDVKSVEKDLVKEIVSDGGDIESINVEKKPEKIYVESVKTQSDYFVEDFDTWSWDDTLMIRNTADYRDVNDMATGKGVVVAVVDTGLSRLAWDFNYKNILPGYSVLKNQNPDFDGCKHGTSVALTIAGARNKAATEGLAFDAKILPIKVDDNECGIWVHDMIEGILYAVNNGADIINISLSTSGNIAALSQAIDYANEKGVIVVASAGNNRLTGNEPRYPASYDSVFAVGAYDSAEKRMAIFSNDTNNDFIMEGVNVPIEHWASHKTRPKNGDRLGLDGFNGTSAAAPLLTSVIALMFEKDPSLTHDEIYAILKNSTKHRKQTKKSSIYGWGMPSPSLVVEHFVKNSQGKELVESKTINSNGDYKKQYRISSDSELHLQKLSHKNKWETQKIVKTKNRTGSFNEYITDGKYRVWARASKTHRAAVIHSFNVKVKLQKQSIKNVSTTVGSKVTRTVTARKGSIVILEKKNGKKWVRVSAKIASSNNKTTLKLNTKKAFKKTDFRVTVSDNGSPATTIGSFTVTVKKKSLPKTKKLKNIKEKTKTKKIKVKTSEKTKLVIQKKIKSKWVNVQNVTSKKNKQTTITLKSKASKKGDYRVYAKTNNVFKPGVIASFKILK